MNASPRDPDRTLTRRRAVAILAFFALNLIVYLIRIVSVWRYGSLFCPTAAESPMIDSVWRLMNHRTLYPWPFAPPFSLTLYNFLFYHFYAAVLGLIGAVDGGILTWGRQLTVFLPLSARSPSGGWCAGCSICAARPAGFRSPSPWAYGSAPR